jgi:hypothetical protein
MIDNYNGTPLSALNLWDLGQIEKSLDDAEAKREEASKHFKFDKVNNKKALTFPPINPEFLNLRDAVKAEIKSRQVADVVNVDNPKMDNPEIPIESPAEVNTNA